MDECCEHSGYKLAAFDTERDPQQDLLDDERWRRVESKIDAQCYDSLLTSPPCGTFAAIRGKGPGPRAFTLP